MAPYLPHGTVDVIFADLEDAFPPDITALPAEACLALPDVDPDEGDWVPAVWHPDKPSTICHTYQGDLAAGWWYLWTRVGGVREYRHGKVRLT